MFLVVVDLGEVFVLIFLHDKFFPERKAGHERVLSEERVRIVEGIPRDLLPLCVYYELCSLVTISNEALNKSLDNNSAPIQHFP